MYMDEEQDRNLNWDTTKEYAANAALTAHRGYLQGDWAVAREAWNRCHRLIGEAFPRLTKAEVFMIGDIMLELMLRKG